MKDKNICDTSRSSSCLPAFYQKDSKNASGMSEQEVTYVDLKFHTSSVQQKKQRSKNSKAKGSSAPSPVWRLIVGILGIFCLALLIAGGILGVKVFQVSDSPCEQLENPTKETEINQGWKSLFSEHWFQYGKKCYHFSSEYTRWLEGQKTCSSNDARRLQIESKEELVEYLPLFKSCIFKSASSRFDFINPLASFHWIGLSRDKTYKPWMWREGTAFSTDRFPVKKGYVDGDCAVVSYGEFFSDDCKDAKRYICEQPTLLLKHDI